MRLSFQYGTFPLFCTQLHWCPYRPHDKYNTRFTEPFDNQRDGCHIQMNMDNCFEIRAFSYGSREES